MNFHTTACSLPVLCSDVISMRTVWLRHIKRLLRCVPWIVTNTQRSCILTNQVMQSCTHARGSSNNVNGDLVLSLSCLLQWFLANPHLKSMTWKEGLLLRRAWEHWLRFSSFCLNRRVGTCNAALQKCCSFFLYFFFFFNLRDSEVP